MHIREAKAHLRQAIKDRLAHLNDKDRHAESRSLCRRILEALPEGQRTICAYFPLKDEADLRPLLKELLRKSHHVYLPRVEGGKVAFRRMESMEALEPGTWHIPEPPDSAPLLDSNDLDIALIPGRAFDGTGNRLGRGNGGYDIWIRKQRQENPKTQYWGIALEYQMTQEVPSEEHDEKMNSIVTARGMLTLQP